MDSLAHPERAAAWLRRRVLGGARGRHLAASRASLLPLGADRLHALRQVGVETGPAQALASLHVVDRAALALANVERLAEADVADALGVDIPAARRRIRRARRRYAEAAVRQPAVPRRGPLTELLRNVALDTMGPGGAEGR